MQALISSLGSEAKALNTPQKPPLITKLPVVIFPTIASTDAPCTALAVIYKHDGSFDRYLFLPTNPDVVLADSEILASAPPRFFAAGIGDALATYFEARACFKENGDNLGADEAFNNWIGNGRLCYDTLLENGVKAMQAVKHGVSTRAVEDTIEATIGLKRRCWCRIRRSCRWIRDPQRNDSRSFFCTGGGSARRKKFTFGFFWRSLFFENAPAEEF